MNEVRPTSPYANQAVKVKDSVLKLGGKEFIVEDWGENVYGKSWMASNGNPAALEYAFRAGKLGLPIDNEVLYGKIDGLGYLMHVSELDLPEVE